MKAVKFVLVLSATLWITRSFAETSGSPVFLSALAQSDVIGIGTYGGRESGGTRINNITYWLGDTGTNSVLLTPLKWLDGPLLPTSTETNNTVIFLGTRFGWNSFPSNAVFRTRPLTAWELREKLSQAGARDQTPSESLLFPGAWTRVNTNTAMTINFVSNVVQSLCVSPDLIRYSQSLIPPLDVGWDNELSLFKADAHMEMLKLGWGESEDFLVDVLNDPLQPRKFRGHALFQLQKRFGWSETNTVPEL
jgi:hypothetical protein